MKVNIYLETDKQCQARVRRRYGYVIEAVYAGRTETREGFGNSSSTYHQCNLQALIEALSRFRSTCERFAYIPEILVTSRVLSNFQIWQQMPLKIQREKISKMQMNGKGV